MSTGTSPKAPIYNQYKRKAPFSSCSKGSASADTFPIRQEQSASRIPLTEIRNQYASTSTNRRQRRLSIPNAISVQSPLLPSPTTALQLLQRHQQRTHTLRLIPNGLESWLSLARPGIYELVGEAGTGKSQTALSVCVQAASSTTGPSREPPLIAAPTTGTDVSLHLIPCRAIYISLKAQNNVVQIVKRLEQMVLSRQEQRPASTPDQMKAPTRSPPCTILQRILTRAAWNAEQLTQVLDELPVLLKSGTVRVLVLDSIADMFRTSEDTDGTRSQQSSHHHAARSAILFGLAARLKKLSDVFDVPVLVINQVALSGVWTKPALGLSWAHCIDVRYILIRQERGGDAGVVFGRRVTLDASSSHATGQHKAFFIRADGVVAG